MMFLDKLGYFFECLLTNKHIIIGFISWFLSQLIKSIYDGIKSRDFSVFVKRFINGSGGMPSSHSAFIGALVVSIFVNVTSAQEAVLALGFGVLVVVLFDAMNVRLESSKHALIINKLLKTNDDELKSINKLLQNVGKDKTDIRSYLEGLQKNKKDFLEEKYDLKEKIGHTPAEVIVGFIIGMVVAIIMGCLIF